MILCFILSVPRMCLIGIVRQLFVIAIRPLTLTLSSAIGA